MAFVLLLCVLLLSPANGEEKKDTKKDGLFSFTDDVVPLNNVTLFKLVVNSNPDNKVWTVEFYNSWCGHCINFAPIWKSLATELKEYNDVVGLAAIDCSQPNNVGTCRSFGITAYPTLRIFPPIYNSSRSEILIDLKSEQRKAAIKNAIFKVLGDFPTMSWPPIKPLEKIEDIWRDKKDHHKHVLLIFEEFSSNVGPEVMLSTRHIPNVLVRRMLKDEVMKFGITKFPSLYKVNKDSTYTFLAVGSSVPEEDEENKKLFVKVIQSLDGVLHVSKVKQQSHGSLVKAELTNSESNESTVKPQLDSSKVTMQDLESALHYSLRQEVAIIRLIDGERLEALKEYIHVLLKYFPGRRPLLGFIDHIFKMLNNLKVKSLTGKEWLDNIDQAQDMDNYLPSVIKWESCLGSAPHYRGYPCGMWTLFHVLTVEAYHQHHTARPNDMDKPQEVLLAIKGYMKYFFGCQECSENFLSMAQTIDNEVKDWKDEVMWLWSAHNKANKRLHNDISEDPVHPKVQFPPELLCPACQNLAPSDQGIAMSWDPDKVLEFLLSFYSEKNIVFSIHLQNGKDDPSVTAKATQPKTGKDLDWWEKKQRQEDLKQIWHIKEQKKLRTKEQKRSVGNDEEIKVKLVGTGLSSVGFLNSWGLTKLDVSMCVAFYLFSTIIILLLYHHFIGRKRLVSCKNPKHCP